MSDRLALQRCWNHSTREAVARRAAGQCERDSCGTRRSYPGFLDVHHILGIEVSDRVWTCVALCPNCHREAHFAPDRDAINAQLRAFAAPNPPTRAVVNPRTKAKKKGK